MDRYFHQRAGDVSQPVISVEVFRECLASVIRRARVDELLQEASGKACPDDDIPRGKYGGSLEEVLLIQAGLVVDAPVERHMDRLSLPQLLTVVEVLYEVVSKGKEESGRHHDYGGCGWHYTEFDPKPAQAWLRSQLTKHLAWVEDGYVLNEQGRVMLRMDEPVAKLLDSKLPQSANAERRARVEAAVVAFRSAKSSWEDRLMQVNLLAGVLEAMRDEAKAHLRKDEQALFNTFNNFGVRHLNDKQAMEYDRPMFLTYVFYVTLAGIHLCERLLARKSAGA
jgi:hypothetical protein